MKWEPSNDPMVWDKRAKKHEELAREWLADGFQAEYEECMKNAEFAKNEANKLRNG